MKSFFRNITFAAMLSVLAIASFAQTTTTPAPAAGCDLTAINALDVKIRDLQKGKDVESRRQLIEASKQYLAKFKDCKAEEAVLLDYLGKKVPEWETNLGDVVQKQEIAVLEKPFLAAVNSKNWDQAYVTGKALIAKFPEKRSTLLVLGSIGLDETAKTPRNTKYNDDTLRYAKMAIADLEANKTFDAFGTKDLGYPNKEDALGWMNWTVGYILLFDKKQHKEAMPYLYKATQVNSSTKENNLVYAALGDAALDDYNKINTEIEAFKLTQSASDPDDVKQQKIDALKAKSALSLGAAERVLDYWARAYTMAKRQNKPNAPGLYKLVQDLYQRRFENTNGIDAWISARTAQPVPNPSTPIQPVVDTAPVALIPAPATGSTTAPATTTPAKPVTTVKPGTTTVKPAAPAAKPVANPGTKPAKPR